MSDETEFSEDAIEAALAAAEARHEAETGEALPEDDVTPEVVEKPDPEVEAAEVKLAAKPKPDGRNQRGQFQKGHKRAVARKQDLDQNADVSEFEVEPEAGQVETQPPSEALPIEAPTFWSAEEKQALAKSPRDVQEIVSRKEKQRTEWANRVQQESERYRDVHARFNDVVKRFAESLPGGDRDAHSALSRKIRDLGAKDVYEVFERALNFNIGFEEDPKAELIKLMRRNNLTPQDLVAGAQDAAPQEDSRTVRPDDEFTRKVDELSAWREQQENERLQTTINQFRQGKDSRGMTRDPFAKLYAPQITQAFEAAQRMPEYQGRPMEQLLDVAYEFILSEVSKVHGFNITPAAKPPVTPPAQRAEAARKAQAASKSVTGGPSSGAAPKRPAAKSIEEAMNRAEERLGWN